VPQEVLEANRIKGSIDVQPSRGDAVAIQRGRRPVFAILKLCIDEAGLPSCAQFYKTTGYPDYDARILSTAARWRYSPFERRARPEATCAKITIFYSPAGIKVRHRSMEP